MAMQWMDGCDWYTDLGVRYFAFGNLWGASYPFMDPTGGRTGLGAIKFIATGQYVDCPVSGSPTRILGHVHVKFDTNPTSDTYVLVAIVESNATHVSISVAADGSVLAFRSSDQDGTPLGTSSASRIGFNGAWNRIDFDVTVHDTTGVVLVYVNGVEALNLTSKDTRNAQSGVITAVRLNGNQDDNEVVLTTPMWMHDVMVFDTAGTAPTSWVGDRRIKFYGASGAGNSAQFTPSAGSNYQNVDDTRAAAISITSAVAATDVITTPTHGLTTGDLVTCVNTVTSSVSNNSGGVTVGARYFVRSLSSTTLAIYSTSADSLADTNRINITSTLSATGFAFLPAAPTRDTDYNESSTVNFIDSFAHTAASSVNSIDGVQNLFVARKTDGGSRQLVSHLRDTAGTPTNYANSNNHTLTTEYFTYTDYYAAQPDTAAWDQTSLNAHEIGYKQTA